MNIKSNEYGIYKIKRHFVNICEIAVSCENEIIETPPLGSCVAIILYSSKKRIGGIAHCLLSQAPKSRDSHHFLAGKYVDSGLDYLLEMLKKLGVDKTELVAKLVGGASVIQFEDDADDLNIGERNVNQAIIQLKLKEIPIHGSDVGGNAGRIVEFLINSGEVHITGTKFKKKII